MRFNSDHITVELHPLERCEHPNANRRVMSRDLRETKKIAVSQYLREVDILSLVQDKDLCEEKTQVLENVIITGLDEFMPFKSKKVASNEPLSERFVFPRTLSTSAVCSPFDITINMIAE